jgi:hypothetical protein
MILTMDVLMDLRSFRMPPRLLPLLLAVWLCGATNAVGQSVTVRASVTPSQVGVHETLAYTLRIEGVSRDAIETPSPPATTNLVLQQTTPSTRSLSVRRNGEQRSVVTFEWRYQPRRVGVAQIKAATVTVQGRPYSTAPIRLDIVSQSQRPSTAPSAPPIAPPSSRSSPAASGSTLDARDLFIEVAPSATEVYQNEPLVVVYRLFFQPGLQLRHSRLAQAWDANGFWREELDVASRPRPRSQTRNGMSYQTIVLKRAALFPTRTGQLPIDPLRIKTEAAWAQPSRPGRSGRFEPTLLVSDSLTIRARALPEEAPDTFRGTVGQLEMHATLSSDTVTVGDDVRLRVSLEGTGNFATLQPPPFDAPSGVDVYAPTATTHIDRGHAAVRGRKTFTYTLVPTAAGRHRLPVLAFTYFDPEAAAYRTLRTAARTLHVTGTAASSSAPVSTTPVSDAARRPAAAASNDAFSPWMWAGLPLLALLLAGAGWFAYARSSPDATVLPAASSAPSDGPPAQRSPLAITRAQQHLDRAHRHLREGSVKPFYRALERAVLTFVGMRLERATPGLTRSALNDLLQAHDVARDDREALHELLEASDQAQFTPSHPSHDSMEAALNRAQDLILLLDCKLPEAGSPSRGQAPA